MATVLGTSDPASQNLSLTTEEKHVFRQLFQQADTENLGVVTGEVAVKFFERTNVPGPVLGEIWQLADVENRGLLTPPGFSIALRLIGHYQAGRDPTPDLAYQPGPLPKFDGFAPATNAAPPTSTGSPAPLQAQVSGGPIRVPPLSPERVAEYSSLFEKSGAHNGVIPGESAKQIFEKARLPNEVLGQIWNLADREHRGMLGITEFIIAMHLIAAYKSGAMRALPQILPSGLYEAAARRGTPAASPSILPKQLTGVAVRRPQSPLIRPPRDTQPPQPLQASPGDWLVSPQEKARFDSFFDTVDKERRGYITGEQAVGFFSNSGLSEDVLAQIWDLADIKSEGQLNREEFAVAMYLIWQQRSKGGPVPSTLPPALMPPSMRDQVLPPAKATAPTFDNATFAPQQPKSAAEDLFGLDAIASTAPTQFAQSTGASSAFSKPVETELSDSMRVISPAPPHGAPSPATVFKPFMPTSSFGQSLTPQTTGTSPTSTRGAPRPQNIASDDLLGDNDPEVSSRLTQETTELGNLSNQVGTLRTQMQEVQGNKAANSDQLSKTSQQKWELEQRLAQFRAQYEQEVREVKVLEQQLLESRTSTQKLGQDLAMLQGTHQDLQAKFREVATALEADQRENAASKEKIRQVNEEVNALKPELEKMRSEARQQKGMTAINKKQLATNESERDRLKSEINDLTEAAEARAAEARAAEARAAEARAAEARAAEARAAEARAAEARAAEDRAAEVRAAEARAAEAKAVEAKAADESARNMQPASPGVASGVTSPSASAATQGTNPFFRRSPAPPDNAMSPGGFASELPLTNQNQSSFDSIFGPSSFSSPPASGPPATSFKSESQRDIPFPGPSGQSMSSSEGPHVPTTPTSPPLSSHQESPLMGEPPVPPEYRQITSSALPIRGNLLRSGSITSSTRVSPPASRFGPSSEVAAGSLLSNAASASSGTNTPSDRERPHTAMPEPDPAPIGSSTAGSGSDDIRQMAGRERERDSDMFRPSHRDTIPGAFPGAFPEGTDSPGQETPTAGSTASSRLSQDAHLARADPFSLGNGQRDPATARDDFDTAFAGLQDSRTSAEGRRAGDTLVNEPSRRLNGANEEFPPIQNLRGDEESDSDDEPGLSTHVTTSEDHQRQIGENQAQIEARPVEQADEDAATMAITEHKTASAPRGDVEKLPSADEQSSPPTYDQSISSSLDKRRESSHFPPEFAGLLPSREDPTSPPSHSLGGATRSPDIDEQRSPSQTQDVQSAANVVYSPPAMSPLPLTSQSTISAGQGISTLSRDFPWLTSGVQPVAQPPATDDFDAAFNDMDEAQADKGDDDFTFVNAPHEDEFNPSFDPPASSPPAPSPPAFSAGFPMQSTQSPFASSSSERQAGAMSSGFGQSTTSSVQGFGQSKGQQQQLTTSNSHDWDSIFSGLDNSRLSDSDGARKGTAKSPFDLDPEAGSRDQPTSSVGASLPQLGRALSAGTEHDDPILKRLTGMGYGRAEALAALEKFDYNIDKAADYLTSNS